MFAEYLLKIKDIKSIKLSDDSRENLIILYQKFSKNPFVTRNVVPIPVFHTVLNRMTDLTVVNLPNFHWGDSKAAKGFKDWIQMNRQWMRLFLLYTDTFPEDTKAFLQYPERIEKNLNMKIITHYPCDEEGEHRLVLVEC